MEAGDQELIAGDFLTVPISPKDARALTVGAVRTAGNC